MLLTTTDAIYEECGSHRPQQVSPVATTRWLQRNSSKHSKTSSAHENRKMSLSLCEGCSLRDFHFRAQKTLMSAWNSESKQTNKQTKKHKILQSKKVSNTGVKSSLIEQLNDMHVGRVTYILLQDMAFRSQMVPYTNFSQ